MPRHLPRLLVGATAVALAAQAPPPIEVIDADTVRQGGITWRLAGMDAPEVNHARCAGERHLGIIAAARLLALLGERGGSIESVGDAARLDRWRRRVGRLLIGGSGGEDWAAIAIREGLAVAYDGRTKRPNWCGG